MSRFGSMKMNKDDVCDLIESILACENERLNAQLSGLETGWEHPNTQSSFRVVLQLAKKIDESRSLFED